MRSWLKVTAVLPGSPDDWSVWAERFSRNGLSGTVQTDDPPTMSAFVPPGEEAILPYLHRDLVSIGACVETTDVEEIDWSESWRQFFKPLMIGRRILVRPSWEVPVGAEGRIEIVLDPGQAFGTGDHPTTRLCLELLEKCALAGIRVADIGCGSGILSIAAMKLGATSVDAVDSDLLSVESTIENARRNAVQIEARFGEGFDPLVPGRYGVVVSNIISAAVIGLAPDAAGRVADGGAWIVSGIIGPNWPDVQDAVVSCGFRVEAMREEGDWVAATLRR